MKKYTDLPVAVQRVMLAVRITVNSYYLIYAIAAVVAQPTPWTILHFIAALTQLLLALVELYKATKTRR
jgi:hypothetical protein